MPSVLILNGPNLNLLGARQPEVYGSTTLADVEALCAEAGKRLGLDVAFAQSNHEGALIDQIHAAKSSHDAIVLNAGAFTHTSIAIMDAIASVEMPVVEVHLSNIYLREEFRRKSVLTRACDGIIAGFGKESYRLAVEYFKKNQRSKIGFGRNS